jgi:hypothetical protein
MGIVVGSSGGSMVVVVVALVISSGCGCGGHCGCRVSDQI